VKALTKRYGSPKGKVLEVTGSLKTSAGVDRSGGWHEIIDKYPDIKVTSKDGEWDMGKGATIIEDWLTANPDTDALYLGSAAAYGIPSIPILDNLGMWKKIGEEGHVIVTGNDPAGPMLYAMKHGYVDHIYDLGWQFGATALSRAMMDYLVTGDPPKEGDTMPVGVEGFDDIKIVKWPQYAGLIVLSGGVSVSHDAGNWTLEGLYGNGFMAPPNGLAPESGAGLWEGD
jgi:ABC-type sugar transport system substrate-binding protein